MTKKIVEPVKNFEKMVTAPMKKKSKAGKVAGKVIVALIVLALAGTTYYFYQQTQTLKKSSTAAADAENKALIARVGQLIILPTDETPTIATVNDPSKLKDQPFFASAQIGDKVLIYTKAKKAILYRPSTNQIVEVAPLNIGTQAAASAPAANTNTNVGAATNSNQ